MSFYFIHTFLYSATISLTFHALCDFHLMSIMGYMYVNPWLMICFDITLRLFLFSRLLFSPYFHSNGIRSNNSSILLIKFSFYLKIKKIRQLHSKSFHFFFRNMKITLCISVNLLNENESFKNTLRFTNDMQFFNVYRVKLFLLLLFFFSFLLKNS